MGLFPSCDVLNGFLLCGADDLHEDPKSSGILWSPFRINDVQYTTLVKNANDIINGDILVIGGREYSESEWSSWFSDVLS
ncbi:MAG: hypothetical protein EA402_06415 [Planctomycetota bacterium]|nr:MAG: hypothetical protein EA402_06415 [Planctomycetota bacterium]